MRQLERVPQTEIIAAIPGANIDVALKKRFDLITQLQPVVEAYSSHEREVQESVARLRSQQQADQVLDPAASREVVAQQNQLVGRFRALREAYPALRADPLFNRLMTTLTHVEDEVALMRRGYNDAVERYNRGTSKLPEVFIAKPLLFRPKVAFVATMAANSPVEAAHPAPATAPT